MKKPLITIVVPIYNVEKYLDRCINSIINQTYKNLEIILVDDGSPDNCPKMCDEYAKKDKRIKVIHKKNAGLGEARNSGIKASTGEYIAFFDSDDYIDLSLVNKCVEAMHSKEVDVIIWGFCINDNNKISYEVPNPKKSIYIGDEVINELLPDMISYDPVDGITRHIPVSVCGALFKTELFKKYGKLFASERTIISEDVYAILDLYKNVKSVVIINECLYYYCYNGNSLTHSYKDDRYERIKYFYDEAKKIIQKNDYPNEIYERIKHTFLNFTVGALKMIMNNNCLSKKEKRNKIRRIVLDEEMQVVINNINFCGESKQKKIFYRFIKNKWPNAVYFLLRIKYFK